MTMLRSAITVALAAGLTVSGASAQPKPGRGLLDGLTPDGPRQDPGGSTVCPPPVTTPPPVGAGPTRPAPTPPATGPAAQPADPVLDREIEAARKLLEQWRGMRRDQVPPLRDPDRAREVLERYRRAVAGLKTEVAAADEERIAKVRERDAAFHTRFDPHRAAIESGTRPDGMSPAEWAALCDDYYLERAKLEAALRGAARQLEGRARPPTDAEQRLAEAERAIQAVEQSARAQGPDVAWRMHQARIAILAQRLRELEQLRTERAGKESGRVNASTSAAYFRDGDWYVDTMNWLAREMNLSGRAGPPTDASQGDGLPIPTFVEQARKMSTIDKQQSRIRWVHAQMEALSQSLADARLQVEQADRLQLDQYEQELRAEDRKTDVLLADTVKALQRHKRVEELKAQQDATRQDRIAELRQRLQQELDAYAKRLQTENERLDELKRREAASTPNPAPAPAPAPPGR